MKVFIYIEDFTHCIDMEIDLAALCNAYTEKYNEHLDVFGKDIKGRKAYPISRAKKLLKLMAQYARYEDIPKIYEYLLNNCLAYANIFSTYI